jgi:hypothetical protein
VATSPEIASRAANISREVSLCIRRPYEGEPPANDPGVRPDPFWDDRAPRSKCGRLLQPSTCSVNGHVTANVIGSARSPIFVIGTSQLRVKAASATRDTAFEPGSSRPLVNAGFLASSLKKSATYSARFFCNTAEINEETTAQMPH